jgi:ribonucleoside-triphosphate reductase
MKVLKRDGKSVNFDRTKIENAVLKACKSVEKDSCNNILTLASRVENTLLKSNTSNIRIETIQDLVEKELMHIDEEVAKAYILYRNKRNRIRRNRIYKQIDEMIQAKKNDMTNENGNMNSETPSGMISKVGFESSKEFTLDSLFSHTNRMAHEKKDIHIHDLDFYLTKSLTCIQTDLTKAFKEGFTTVNGGVRPPKRISTAAGLTAISIQTSQNEMHGGQSIHAFDFYMAPYVKMSFDEHYKEAFAFFKGEKIEKCDIIVDEYTEKSLDGLEGTERVKQFAVNQTIKETKQAMEGLIHDLNIMSSRSGNQVPFSSINLGTDTSAEGRMVIKAFLEAVENGVGKERKTAIFPISIFKVKSGVNRNKEDKNYDLFMLAQQVTAKRFFPNFINLDAPFNHHEKWDINDPQRWYYETSTMGCRTRVFENRHGEKSSVGRGNASFTSVNIVRAAIKAMKHSNDLEERKIYFFEELDRMLNVAAEQLYDRWNWQKTAVAKQFSYVMKYLAEYNDGIKPNDKVEDIIKNFSLSIGFIGLAECLVALTSSTDENGNYVKGKHHGESDESQKLGLQIVEHMNGRCKEYSEKFDLNYGLIATPAEGLSHTFTDSDKRLFGEIEGVTDREYYTNSNHVPVYYKCSIIKKAEVEAPYHALTTAGHIFYIEMDGNPLDNLKAVNKAIEYMLDLNIGYVSINHFDNYCLDCGAHFYDRQPKACPICGSEDLDITERITGYLVGNLDKWNRGKLAEQKDRVAHDI